MKWTKKATKNLTYTVLAAGGISMFSTMTYNSNDKAYQVLDRVETIEQKLEEYNPIIMGEESFQDQEFVQSVTDEYITLFNEKEKILSSPAYENAIEVRDSAVFRRELGMSLLILSFVTMVGGTLYTNRLRDKASENEKYLNGDKGTDVTVIS